MAVDNYSTITQPPLGLAYLAAYARQLGHEVRVIDAVGDAVTRISPWPKRARRLIQGLGFDEILSAVPKDADIIGLTCMFTHAWPMIRELMAALKQRFPKAKLIAGGEHVTAMHETVLRQTSIDVCVLGEGELTLGALLNTFKESAPDLSRIQGIAYLDKSDKLVKTLPRERIKDPDTLPRPAWDLLDPMAYMASAAYMGPNMGRSIPLLATRGCPFRCTFCSSASMWTQVWKPREPSLVVDEMESYMKSFAATDFQFQDLTAIVRKDWIVSFCKELIRRKLELTWQLPVGTRSEAIDGEVAELLMASGCRHITYAPESGSDRILKLIEKKVHLGHLESSVRSTLKAGMRVCLFQVIGFPQEKRADIKKTLRWIRRMARLGVHEVAVSTFVPLPGTSLFDEISKTKPIVVDDEYCYWMAGSTSLFSVRSWNPGMSDRKLLRIKLWAMIQFYTISFLYHPSRLWRFFKNALSGKQETKIDRVVQEFILKIKALRAAP